MAGVPPDTQFRCCICLDAYTDPVSIPCGHNFCLDCIEGFWDTRDKPECPLCKEAFRKRPRLRINRDFAEIIEFFKRSLPPISTHKEDVDAGSRKQFQNPLVKADEVPCDVCRGDKSPSVKSCLMCQTSYCELHLTPHGRDPALQRHRLTDPATFATSHLCRNHNRPLTMFCKSDQMPVCVKCTERDHKHHETMATEKESKKTKAQLRSMKADIQQMIQARLTKMHHIKKSVELSKKIATRELQSSAQACSMLLAAVERQQARLLEEIQERQGEAETRAEELLDELEQEIIDLQTRSSELQHLELTESTLHLLQSFPSLCKLPPTKQWSEVAVHSDHCMGTVRRAVSELVDVCQELADKLCAEEADQMEQYAADVTFDPVTASGCLVLSPDRNKVSSQSS